MNIRSKLDGYEHESVESKWQSFWNDNNIFFTDLSRSDKPKKYILSMFPYPSGSGLHVGHVRNYTIADASARFYRMLGFNVLFPIGWDSFGLPSEQYAIETNRHPATFTYKNIENFKRQLKSLGFSYDWSKEINTSDPNYYSITQWMFGKIFSEGLAEYKNYPVLWCESLSTVLSNEEVKTVEGKMFSERGSFPVVNKNIEQWIIRITEYSKDLSEGLNNLDWPLSIKNLQRNWIGFTEGSKISFQIVGKEKSLDVFTTRIDTIYGVNSLALSYSNDICEEIIDDEHKESFFNFKEKWESFPNNNFSNDLEGVFTGSYCLNPFSGKEVPIWVTNFVIDNYGTGCLMISPFSLETIENSLKSKNDFLTKKEAKQNFEIDYSFSSKFNLPITKIVLSDEKFENYEYVNSGIINGLKNKKEALEILNNAAIGNKFGCLSKSCHLKDWVFSRQRYWGEPIPVVHLNNGSKILIPEKDLPLELPHLGDFTPSKEFYSPLQKAKDWISFEKNEIKGVRDVNVMPQWAGSCWYYIAFLLVKKSDSGKPTYLEIESEKAKEIINRWMPVDLYVGGQEHANLHLLYARFWNSFLSDQKVLPQKEPFKKLLCQGMIVSDDGSKMSKSKGNIINPDYCVKEWGADSLRLYEMFVSPPSQTAQFKISGIYPMRKWLVKIYNFFVVSKEVSYERNSKENKHNLNTILFEIIDNYKSLKFNLVVSKLMEFINAIQDYQEEKISIFYAKAFLQLLNPLAPHISEEIWDIIKPEKIDFNCLSNSSLDFGTLQSNYNFSDQEVSIIVKINNKFKSVIRVSNESNSEKSIINLLKKDNTLKFDSKITKVFFVKGKTINILTEH